MDELKDALEVSSPSDAVVAESSPAETVNTETPVEATTQKAEPVKEPPFNEHPRWKEVQQEKERARQEAEYWRQQAAQALEVAKGYTPKAQEPDEYANMTPEEKAFFQRVEQIADRKADEKIQQIKKTYDPYIEKYERETVASVVEEFEAKNPEITAEEKVKIAQIAKPLRLGGYTVKEALSLAHKAVCSDKIAQKTVQQAKVQTTQKIQQKAAATLETSSISTALPTKAPKETVREFGMRMFKEGKF